jgi:hypothetical protein
MFVVYDLEFTTWPGAQDRGWTHPTEFREIVQIGALRVSPASMAVEDEYEALIKPARNPDLSDFFVELTGITREELDRRGQDFATALNGFLRFCGGDYALSYGNDMVIIGENIILQFPEDQAPALPMPPFVNVRPYINRLIPATRWLSAGSLARGLGEAVPAGGVQADGAQAGGVPAEGEPMHNALQDCYAILEALRHLRKEGRPLFSFEE